MIIGLIGYAQSGKDTVAEILVNKYGFNRKAFADNIRKFLYEMNYDGVRFAVDSVGWDRAKQMPNIREALQNAGVAARTILGEDVWVDAVMKEIDSYSNYVITDVRFKNEATTLKLLGAELWRIERPGVGPVNQHISETELEGLSADRTLLNGGTLDELEMLVKIRLDSALANKVT